MAKKRNITQNQKEKMNKNTPVSGKTEKEEKNNENLTIEDLFETDEDSVNTDECKEKFDELFGSEELDEVFEESEEEDYRLLMKQNELLNENEYRYALRLWLKRVSFAEFCSAILNLSRQAENRVFRLFLRLRAEAERVKLIVR